MGNKIQYFLICILATLAISACTPSNSINNVDTVPKIGDTVPNISWTTINGEKIDLDRFKGSWVLLCYWCPCPEHRDGIIEIRNVFYESYGQDIEVVVVDDHSSYWPEVTLKGFAKENNLPFYLVEDNQNSIVNIKSDSNNIHSRPIYFLIDTMGRLNAIKLGSFNYAEGKENEVITFLHYENLKVCDIAPDFTSTTTLGNRISLSQFKGNWVLLHFVCGCPSHMQDLDFIKYAYENYNNLKAIVAIDWAQCGGDIADFTQYNKPEFNLIEDNDMSIMKAYHLPKKGRPQSFLIDENGLVRARLSRLFHDEDTMKFFLKEVTAINRSNLAAPNIFNAKISKITDKSAEIYWETDVEALGTATIHKYIDGTDAPLNSQKIDFIEDIYFTRKHSFTVSSLEPRRLYNVGLNAKDRIGRVADYSVAFLTQPSNYTHGAKISNISLYDITDRIAKLKWSTDKSVWSSACYKYECSSGDINTEHSYTLSYGLEPDTEYWVQILAHGESVSDVFNFKTLKATDIKER